MRPIILVCLYAATACAKANAPTNAVRLYDNLGTFSVPISSKVPEAQRYFDQGLRLSFAFNHAEAIRSFREAARHDPNCAICYWGIAYAAGPNINAPMDSAGAATAWTAIQQARTLLDKASAREQGLIAALEARYGADGPTNQASRDSAYANAMAELARKAPTDLEAATLHAEARMNLRPWDYWVGVGKPHPGTEVLMGELERVLGADSTHPGACHFYIHAVEATEPEKALRCAEHLAARMPGAGHMVHMPAHIYVRVGRYQDAIAHNHDATHADSTLAASERISPAYATLYVTHNYHLLGFAAMLAGDQDLAIRAGRRTAETMPIDGARGAPEFQPLLAFEHLMLQKFGRWEALLALPLPDSTVPIGRAVAEYARGTALAATGRFDEAGALVSIIAARGSGNWSPIAKGIVDIAHQSLLGEIAARRGRPAQAERHFRAAMAVEDGFSYMEPPWWIEPVRQALGKTLLDAKRFRDAERLYREDLARFPNNVWSVVGLQQSLSGQGKAGSAPTSAVPNSHP